MRLPRTLVGLMTGAALGVAGAVMQAVTRNPLADPGPLGVNAGASAAVVFGIGVIGLARFGSLVWFSFAGAALTTVVVYVLGASGRAGPAPVRLALAGAAVSASLSGVIAGLTVFGSATYDYLRFWMVGSLAGREPELVVQLLFTALVWADERIGWIQVVEESQRNNLLPVGVTTAVLGGVYLAWVPFKRRGTGTA
ncbi:FecCD family ABC transporter permease [Streptomyces cyaneofuscatus]|uniref:FecCD family ABC transporter permease n=1 Tax=Streptomyces cyaneofuscatus TaxID=66883 RepID=UPI0033AA2FB7